MEQSANSGALCSGMDLAFAFDQSDHVSNALGFADLEIVDHHTQLIFDEGSQFDAANRLYTQIFCKQLIDR